MDGKLFHQGYTHPILTCVSGDQCTHIMAELHARRGKNGQEERMKVYPGGWKVVPSWLHSSYPHMCK